MLALARIITWFYDSDRFNIHSKDIGGIARVCTIVPISRDKNGNIEGPRFSGLCLVHHTAIGMNQLQSNWEISSCSFTH